MTSDDKFTRRDFIASGAAFTLGSLVGAQAEEPEAAEAATTHSAPAGPAAQNLKVFSRYSPSFGGPPGSDHYLGKLMPGLRGSGLPPVMVQAPDLDKVPFKKVGGVKEFELRCMAVKREFLPGYFMNVWGFNGSMPGPTIEAFQGDRVRIIVKNELPEGTSMHWHGLELPIAMDGVPGLVQDLIVPGGSFAYEFDLHQTGSFFYHAHVAMQEALGMVGMFIIHPRIAYDPPVDRDFALIYQNFFIPPNADVADTTLMDWNWHTINGRCGPYTTPMVVKHGERVRVRLVNFSPMQHHPIHFHGHTFWLTGTEGGRIPDPAWTPRNNTLV
ncbi:MAG: multicopper oxidase family protein, partial [Terriglobales bacterium]